MASPPVETKLHAPKLRPSLVARPRLSERLRRGAESRLTLISAPAGFGKTTSLAEWLAATGRERGPWRDCPWRRATASPLPTGST